MALFHDTAGYRISRMHGPERTYQHRVKDYVEGLKEDPQLQVFDVPFGDGITIVRKVELVSGAAPSAAGEPQKEEY
jgi:predicted O-methyltransferase YrrM